jgi:hypothetical protein
VFRRRVVFELTVDQLPLLDAAEARHGSKRRALLAALQAETRVEELEREAAAAQAALAKRGRAKPAAAPRPDQNAGKDLAAARTELDAARAELDQLRAQLDGAHGEATEAHALAAADRDEYEDALAARDEEIADLEERAVDRLYCARCNTWAEPHEWAWGLAEGGGGYAYHDPCGDHGPGLLGAPSWLAYRDQ